MRKIWLDDERQKQNHKEGNVLALHQESFPLKEGMGSILNQGNSLSAYEVFEESDSSSSSFTETTSRRWSGSFLEKEELQNPFTQSILWSDDRWKACLAAGGGAKRTIPVLHR